MILNKRTSSHCADDTLANAIVQFIQECWVRGARLIAQCCGSLAGHFILLLIYNRAVISKFQLSFVQNHHINVSKLLMSKVLALVVCF